jgi:sRNA-binding carbon storage regulator CsrA
VLIIQLEKGSFAELFDDNGNYIGKIIHIKRSGQKVSIGFELPKSISIIREKAKNRNGMANSKTA